MQHDPGREFWTPEPIWAGRTVYCVAGGPSLRGFAFDRLRGRTVLAINVAAYDLPFADAWYFMDNGLFEEHRALAESWPGLILTASRHAKRAMPGRVRRIDHETRPDFPAPGAPVIRHGRSSGHMGVSVAIACAAARVVLLGYDMKPVARPEGGLRTHYHEHYAHNGNGAGIYAAEFVPAFAGWDAAARARGVDIVNATPGSALTEFRMLPEAETLAAAEDSFLAAARLGGEIEAAATALAAARGAYYRALLALDGAAAGAEAA